jgi:hypothetical protein
MNLSTRIIEARAAECERWSTAMIGASVLAEWAMAAGNLERDQRSAWRSFYVACCVVGVLLATVAWQRLSWHPSCEAAAPVNVMKLDPTQIRARGSEVYEL